MHFIEDHQGGDVTEFEIHERQAVLIVTHDYKDFFKVVICNRDDSPIKWTSNWLNFRMLASENPSHISFGELEVVEVEKGHVYLDCDFGSFDFIADQTIPPSKKQPNQSSQPTSLARRG